MIQRRARPTLFSPLLQGRIEDFQNALAFCHLKKSWRVTVTLTKLSGDIWLEADKSVLCNLAYIVFNVARVDRRHYTVVPFIMYNDEVLPYQRRLCSIPAVRDGQRRVLNMNVVLEPREFLLDSLFKDSEELSYENNETSVDEKTRTT